MFPEIEPCFGLCAYSVEAGWDSPSPSTSAPLGTNKVWETEYLTYILEKSLDFWLNQLNQLKNIGKMFF